MRLAVFSDTHGRYEAAFSAIRAAHPDLIIHLGDFSRDADEIKKEFPHTPMRAVRGNCDMVSAYPETEVFSCGAAQVMITHGHRYHVKSGLDSLLLSAKLSDVNLVLFGHTHVPHYQQFGKLHVLNPGTAGQGRRRTWALVDILDNGAIQYEMRELED